MESRRLIYGRFERESFQEYFSLTGDGQVMRMITGKPAKEEEAKQKFDEILALQLTDPKFGYFRVLKKDNQAFIGLAKIVQIAPDVAEIGYSLRPEHWGNGYGSEICTFLISASRQIKNIVKLTAIIDPDNLASARILQKNGFLLVKSGVLDGLPAEIYDLVLH